MTAIEWLGWLGNACFFSRVALQWIAVERARTQEAPRVFWLLSLAGSLLLGAFAIERGTWVLLVGFAVNGAIYLRNLRLGALAPLAGGWTGRRALPLALGVALLLAVAAHARGPRVDGEIWAWTGLAVVGQSIWSSRFVVQWWFSERSGHSHFPPAFWIFSLAGNLLLLAYAVRLGEPVFVAGLVLGPIVQLRNLWLTGTVPLDPVRDRRAERRPRDRMIPFR